MLALLLAGCNASGRLYTKKVEPYTTDFDRTPVGSKSFKLRSHKIQEPITRYNISAEWDTRTIREAAARAGMTNIYFADREILSVAFGIYSRKTLILYGD